MSPELLAFALDLAWEYDTAAGARAALKAHLKETGNLAALPEASEYLKACLREKRLGL